MTVKFSFVGGPMDGLRGQVSEMHQCQVFFDEKARTVILYNRVDDLVYEYEPAASKVLTAKYDESFAKLRGLNSDTVKFAH